MLIGHVSSNPQFYPSSLEVAGCHWLSCHHLAALCVDGPFSTTLWQYADCSGQAGARGFGLILVYLHFHCFHSCVCVCTYFLVNEVATKPRGPVSKTIKFGATRRVNLKIKPPKTCYCCLLSMQRCKLMEICSACSEWGQLSKTHQQWFPSLGHQLEMMKELIDGVWKQLALNPYTLMSFRDEKREILSNLCLFF